MAEAEGDDTCLRETQRKSEYVEYRWSSSQPSRCQTELLGLRKDNDLKTKNYWDQEAVMEPEHGGNPAPF